MLPGASQKLVVPKEVVKIEDVYRIPIMAYFNYKKVNMSIDDCCKWVNKGFKFDGFTLTSSICRATFSSFIRAGLLFEDYPMTRKGELTDPELAVHVGHYWRLTTEEVTGPGSALEEGMANAGVQNCAACLWPVEELSVLELAQQMEGSPTGDHNQLRYCTRKLSAFLAYTPAMFEERTQIKKSVTGDTRRLWVHERSFALTSAFRDSHRRREDEARQCLEANSHLLQELDAASLYTSSSDFLLGEGEEEAGKVKGNMTLESRNTTNSASAQVVPLAASISPAPSLSFATINRIQAEVLKASTCTPSGSVWE